jgi:hypothetical protein
MTIAAASLFLLSDDDMASTGITALVTGGAGFIGSHLVEALLARGDRVVVIDDLSTGDMANLAAVADHPRLHFVHGTVANESLLRELLPGIGEVYHLAAAVGVGLIASNPIQTIETNITPTERLLAELRRLHGGGQSVRMFLASSSEVYGKNPKAVWTEDDDLVSGSLVVRRIEGHRRISGAGLLATGSAARGRWPAVQCGRTETIGPVGDGLAAAGVGRIGRTVAHRP